MVHAAGGLLVLLVITALSVFKPWGRTRYGQRLPQERHENTQLMKVRLDSGNAMTIVGRPMGLKILISAGLIIVAFVLMHLLSGGLGHDSH